MKQLLSAALILSLTALAPAALAGGGHGKHHHKHHHQHHGNQTEYARVIESYPITETVRVSSPQRECWEEITRYENHNNGTTAALIGAVAGGVVGNRFGEGKGKDAMTVAGALLGASIGHDTAYRGGETYPVSRQRCQVRHERHQEERIVGYNVTYRYQGREYSTRMPYDPGDRIRVQVNVSPDY